MNKLYVVVRTDLPMGAQLAQLGHAVAGFAVRFPNHTEAWHEGPNNIVVLEAADESALIDIIDKLGRRPACADAKRCVVQEPDLADAITAVAIEGTPAVAKALSSLPLAHRARQLSAA